MAFSGFNPDNPPSGFNPTDIVPPDFQPINMTTEDFYQAAFTGYPGSDEQSIVMEYCKDLVKKVGGTVREDMSRIFGYIAFTLPNGVDNPIKEDDKGFEGKIYTRFWAKTGVERVSRGTVKDAKDSDVSSDNENGLFCDDTSNFDDNPNDQEAGEEEDIGTADDQLRPLDFIQRVESAGFDGAQALEMLHRLHTIDYGSRQAGSKAVDLMDEFHPLFFLD
ncbi:hypothetical protein BKA61DRAFT_723269 [Leptodontidium sp. MPI-SDFR-AT-0119]|nr:hypothetical protein BKA61DRAFT_723269 [Leptodontidium sp. MPI-SDFR-AT-0119]